MPKKVAPGVLVACASVDETRPLRMLSLELAGIRNALRPPVSDGTLSETRVLLDATAPQIVAELVAAAPTQGIRVFHFAGHAEAGAIIVADGQGAPAAGHAEGLAGYLAQQPGLDLVVLNGCSTQAHVERLRSLGVKAVVATSGAIEDELAAGFATAFYAELVIKPLRKAFDAASEAMSFTHGTGPLRDLVLEELRHGRWREEWKWPWMLECDDAEWRLVPADDEPPRTDWSSAEVDELIGWLAKILHDKGIAIVVLSRIGFPRERVPELDVPLVFWHRVVHELASGVAATNVQALVDEVAGMYPGNTYFSRRRSKR